ncbi:hypothetical protein ABFB09_03900 [Dehalogenimonas sp. THU2]|uniref:hypothetical protein n=1 Tax=Dehalogenimonas sp. THU2 TaxID=3151121 RepID=UPI003218B3B1
MRKFPGYTFRTLSLLIAGVFLLALASCFSTGPDQQLTEKASLELISQMNLRLSQLEQPTETRLDEMLAQGMNVDDLRLQRLYIYLTGPLDPSQITDLHELGITLYMNSWIPPVGAHPYGFLIADAPVDALEELAAKAWVVKLDTAEGIIQPQAGPQS